MEPLQLENLGELDNGFANAAINKALSAVSKDIEDRGDDLKPRKVVITITMEKPQPQRDTVDITLDVKTTLPNYTLAATRGSIVRQGNEVFAEFSPNNPRNPEQGTIYDKMED